MLGLSSEVAHTGLRSLLGLDVNWKSMGASVDLIRDPEAISKPDTPQLTVLTLW